MIFAIGIGVLVLDITIVVVTMLIDYWVFLERKLTNSVSKLVVWLFGIGVVTTLVGGILKWRV